MNTFERIQELAIQGKVRSSYFGKLYELIGVPEEDLTNPQLKLKRELDEALKLYDEGKVLMILIGSRREVTVEFPKGVFNIISFRKGRYDMKRRMKKLFVALCAGAIAFTGLSPVCYVDNTPKVEASVPWTDKGYWNGDTNYPCVYYTEGTKYYIQKSSIHYDFGTCTFTIAKVVNGNDANYKLHYMKVGIKKDLNGAYHIYDLKRNTVELTGYDWQEPTYSGALYAINYLGL